MKSGITLMLAYITAILSLCFLFGATPQNTDFYSLRSRFVSKLNALQLPDLRLDYQENLRLISNPRELKLQFLFFQDIKKQLNTIDKNLLPADDRTDYEIMAYQTDLNLERLQLEEAYRRQSNGDIPTNAGLLSVANGKGWYRYFLKRWIGDSVTPDQIYQFGFAQVKRSQDSLTAIRKQLGMTTASFYAYLNSPFFFIRDEKNIRDSFVQTKTFVQQNLHKLFLSYPIKDVAIRRGTAASLAQTPGYYANDIFYFNLFDEPYCTRQFGWLFIHEAVPGHHFQNKVSETFPKSAVQALFHYSGFAEGWAAYVEEYGEELGLYQTPYQKLGKWEWDLVRSVRIPLDVGINYFGWTDEAALEFWKKNVPNQDNIAWREIKRIRRWPCQVITYKYGAAKFIEWKKKVEAKQGKGFDIKQYHDLILRCSGLPFFMIQKRIFG